MATNFILIAALILSIVVPFGYFLISEKQKRASRFKPTLAVNVFFFFAALIIGNIMIFGGSVFAAEPASATTSGLAAGLGYLAAALVTGMSTVGAGIAVASAASAALGAISEDSSIMGKSLIFVALAEGIALYGLLISFTILNSL